LGEAPVVAGRGPLLLAVETATRVMSVALLRGDALLAEVEVDDRRPHSERLLPGIDRVLAEAGVRLDDVGAYAVSIGPGSFTGLRVGLATVKGLTLEDPRPVAAVPTLAALSLAAVGAGEAPESCAGPVAALLDARRGEVYAAAYSRPGDVDSPRLEESVYAPEALAQALPRGAVLVAGEGALEAALQVADRVGGRIVGDREQPARAAAVGRLGAQRIARGEGRPAAHLVPRYVRRAEAEVRRTGARVESEFAAAPDSGDERL
jgi:tRNA threonylcarbamoyladenosine biosynthesis protein TsaB